VEQIWLLLLPSNSLFLLTDSARHTGRRKGGEEGKKKARIIVERMLFTRSILFGRLATNKRRGKEKNKKCLLSFYQLHQSPQKEREESYCPSGAEEGNTSSPIPEKMMGEGGEEGGIKLKFGNYNLFFLKP